MSQPSNEFLCDQVTDHGDIKTAHFRQQFSKESEDQEQNEKSWRTRGYAEIRIPEGVIFAPGEKYLLSFTKV